MEFTSAYQAELIRKLTNPEFASRVGHLLRPELFDPKYVDVVRDLLEVLKRKERVSSVQLGQLCKRHRVSLGRGPLGSVSLDEVEVTHFVKFRTLRRALAEAHIHQDSGNYEKAVATVVKAGESFPGKTSDCVVDLLDSSRPIPKRKNLIPTGLEKLDGNLGGGIAGGDLAIVMAPTSGGKTAWLCWLTAQCLLKGGKVVYITLEVPAYELEAKLRSCLCGKSNPGKTVWKRTASRLRKNGSGVRIFEYPPNSVTVSELDASITDRVNMIVIDYADYIKPPSGNPGLEYHDLGAIYNALKGVGMRRRIPIWLASQVNRTSYTEKLLRVESVESSLKKVMASDQVITINQNAAETIPDKNGRSTATIFIAKNRHGMRYQEVPVTVDWKTCRFQYGKWA